MQNVKTTNEIRNSFLSFFEQKNHVLYKSAPLIPNEDPTLIFINAGMVPFKEYFINGNDHNITSCQKCVRAGGKHNDLENVGHTTRHHTFFEMLGNFSFGDYFKEEAILYAFEFLTKKLNIDKSKLLTTVYHTDDEAYGIWKSLGINEIQRIKTEDNFWSMGNTGPCGPCSEIFYKYDDQHIVEIWNLVFMEFNKMNDGKLINLPIKCIDTGMGLERISSVIQGVRDNYNLDIFTKLIKRSQSISSNNTNEIAHRIIADHIRSASFLIADGVFPENKGRGYVLRRILRRAIRYSTQISKKPIMHLLCQELKELMGRHYTELVEAEKLIESTIKNEEAMFRETIDNGLELLNQFISSIKSNFFPGEIAFKLYDTYGFPIDLTETLLKERNLSLDKDGFNKCMLEQKNRSASNAQFPKTQPQHELFPATEFIREQFFLQSTVLGIIHENTSINSISTKNEFTLILDKTVFYAESGGQRGDTGQIKCSSDCILNVKDTIKLKGNIHLHICSGSINETILKVGEKVQCEIDVNRRKNLSIHHSATHLLQNTLRDILGDHVVQRGSLVDENHLRFDFSHGKSISKECLNEIEEKVNNAIDCNHKVNTEEMELDQAKKKGAISLFGEKYQERVRVVTIGESIELCGGTHVSQLSDIVFFAILKEQSIGSGVRRIKAVAGPKSIQFILSQKKQLENELEATKIQIKKIKKDNREEINRMYNNLICITPNLSEHEIPNIGLLVVKEFSDIPPNFIINNIKNITQEKQLILVFSSNSNQRYITLASKDIPFPRNIIKEGKMIIEQNQIMQFHVQGKQKNETIIECLLNNYKHANIQ